MTRPHSRNAPGEIDFAKWIEGCIDPIIKHIESLMDGGVYDSNQKAIQAYWRSFAQNSVNLSRVMSNLPHHFTQVMMSFRLLQETSADIFYLKEHMDSTPKLAKASKEVTVMIESGNLTLRNMSKMVHETDIRGEHYSHTTQKRIECANSHLGDVLGDDLTKDLIDINNFLNGYSHFNPAGVYLQNTLTDHGYVEVYMKIFTYYPSWLYLVLVSLSEVLNIRELDQSRIKEIVESLLERIEESDRWQTIEFLQTDKCEHPGGSN